MRITLRRSSRRQYRSLKCIKVQALYDQDHLFTYFFVILIGFNFQDGVLVENMHDVPYIQDRHLGPEITASMTRVAIELRKQAPEIPIGIQILACGNKQALAVAKAADLQFIRAEGFVFGHVADEGYTDACAGTLLRYRKQIQADDVLVLTDVKKKHSSHAITADITLAETVHAAEFFLTDGVILTGQATGDPADEKDLDNLYGKTKLPILIGSGVTLDNVHTYFPKSNGLIIGSYFKEGGQWQLPLSERRVAEFMERIKELRNQRT